MTENLFYSQSQEENFPSINDIAIDFFCKYPLSLFKRLLNDYSHETYENEVLYFTVHFEICLPSYVTMMNNTECL